MDSWGRLIGSEGGWGELGYKVSDKYSLFGGYSSDHPGGGDILDQAGARADNTVWYLGNHFTLGRFEFGVEYFNWTTRYKGLNDGKSNLFGIYSQYNF